MGKYHSIFHFFSFILSVRCCISFGNSGCSFSGATLGGRLVFTGQSGQDVAEAPSWISGRKLVFVTANFPFKRSLGLGRGRIWIGQRGCRGDFCQSTNLSSDGKLPCFADLVDKTNKPAFSKQRSQILQFTDVTPTSMNVTWPAWDNETDVGSGPIAEYQIQIKEAEETQFRSISVEDRLSYLFENLTENTEYDFRVVIFRDHPTHGEGPPSFAQRQRTLPRPPSYREKNVVLFTDVTPSSINVTWPAWDNETDVGSGPISGYQIQIKEAGETQFRSISVEDRLSYLFENLTENTEYDFRVVIFRDHPTYGEGPPSNAQTQRTLTKPTDVPSYSQSRSDILKFSDVTSTGKPIHVTSPAWTQATGESPSSPTQSSKTPCSVHEEDVHLELTTPNWRRGKVVVARWQIADRQASCGTIKKFLNVELRDLDGCPTHSSETIESFDLGDAAGNRKILRDKKPNSLFNVTLSVAYGGGDFYNISKEIRTLETEPTLAPENLRVEVVVSARPMLKFEWTKPPCGGCNGVITKYQTSFTVKGREYKDTTEGTCKIYFIQRFGLMEGDRYTFKVKAETKYGRGPYTEPGCTSVFGTDRC